MIGTPCPCGSDLAYAACCGPLHSGARQAETALELMRSRYAAYAVGGTTGADYVFRTWHPRTRPGDLSLDGNPRWLGLTIEGYGEDWVEFTARYEGGAIHERSRFARRAGRWLYLDGEVS